MHRGILRLCNKQHTMPDDDDDDEDDKNAKVLRLRDAACWHPVCPALAGSVSSSLDCLAPTQAQARLDNKLAGGEIELTDISKISSDKVLLSGRVVVVLSGRVVVVIGWVVVLVLLRTCEPLTRLRIVRGQPER